MRGSQVVPFVALCLLCLLLCMQIARSLSVRIKSKTFHNPTRLTRTSITVMKRSATAPGDEVETSTKKEKTIKVAGDPYPRDPVLPKTLPSDGSYVKILSWNVAGLRGTLKKQPTILSDLVRAHNPDVICLQETKLQESHVKDFSNLLRTEGYTAHWTCSVDKKGYSGNAVFIQSKSCGQLPAQPNLASAAASRSVISTESVKLELDDERFCGEGRTITVEFDKFFLVACYVPNSGQNLERLHYRVTEWDPYIRSYLKDLKEKKPVVFAGDLNCGYEDLDIYNFDAKHISKQAGLTPAERNSFGEMLSQGFFDALRHFHPDKKGQFTYWSQRANGRPVNKGIRLDYFVCSNDMKGGSVKVADSYILHSDTDGASDHCPIVIVLSV